MMYSVSKSDKILKGKINLTASKSINNRLLIIRALSGVNFKIENIAEARDTQTLLRLLDVIASNKSTDELELDALDAGTTFRFLSAYLSTQKGSYLLTGSKRMKERPIGKLVDALKSLGADIQYVEKEGYPPLRIKGSDLSCDEVEIAGNISSQYITAILMIAPTLPNGINLKLVGNVLSRSYIEMTLGLMSEFGIKYEWNDDVISIPNQKYTPKDSFVEADWSSASYWYSIAVLADEVDLELYGLSINSLQGDSVIKDLCAKFGVVTTEIDGGVKLTKPKHIEVKEFDYNFTSCPDIVQTMAVICGVLNVDSTFKGVENLRIKETDRIDALDKELSKIDVDITVVDSDTFSQKSKNISHDKIEVETYDDHRMALAFAPLAFKIGTVLINDPAVVNKSYPGYWDDLKEVGFSIKSL